MRISRSGRNGGKYKSSHHARRARFRREAPFVENLESRTLLSVFQVTNANDSGAGSLRQAIINANADTAADRIEFNIPGAGPHVIHPSVALPVITRPVVIDGYTQPGSSMNTAAVGTNAVLKIQLDGTGLGGNGLNVTGGGVTLRGLVFSNWTEDRSAAIVFDGGASNRVEGCFLGTDPTGLVLQANRGGVWVHGGVTSSVIGTDGDGVNDLGERNLMCGANSTGITVSDTTTTSNVIAGNYFGTDATGIAKLGLLGDAIALVQGTRSNRIGTNFDGVSDDIERNIIVGTQYTGVAVYNDGTDNNVIAGNRIGTNAAGTAARGNYYYGIAVFGSNNTIGGGTAAERNVISGNMYGITISGSKATGNRVQGNFIGTDVTGANPLRNEYSGVLIEGASDNQIGGTAAGQGNTIAFNANSGVKVTGSSTRNAILGNTIYGNTSYYGQIDLGDNVPSASIGLNPVENDSTKTTIRGSLLGTRNATVRVELFASPQDGSGQIFLGSVAVITGDDGLGTFLFATSAPIAADWLVTATATDPARNTSEFAAPRFPVLVPDDVTSQVQVRLGGYLYNRRFQLFVQTITITNTSNTTFVGPISLMIDNLTPDVVLANQSRPAWHVGRNGSPYIDVLASGAVLAPGQSLTITLGFRNPLGLLIHYTPSVLAGPGAR